jgi:hypothetical protein
MSNLQEQEEADFTVASESERDRADALFHAADRPDCAWLLSDRDVWYANPAYKGPPQPHPDYDDHD